MNAAEEQDLCAKAAENAARIADNLEQELASVPEEGRAAMSAVILAARQVAAAAKQEPQRKPS